MSNGAWMTNTGYWAVSVMFVLREALSQGFIDSLIYSINIY